jgi:hypothetical protein
MSYFIDSPHLTPTLSREEKELLRHPLSGQRCMIPWTEGSRFSLE